MHDLQRVQRKLDLRDLELVSPGDKANDYYMCRVTCSTYPDDCETICMNSRRMGLVGTPYQYVCVYMMLAELAL